MIEIIYQDKHHYFWNPEAAIQCINLIKLDKTLNNDYQAKKSRSFREEDNQLQP